MDEEKYLDVKVKDLVQYLLTLDQEASIGLDKDGWHYDVPEEIATGTDVQKLIESRNLICKWNGYTINN